MTDCGYSDLGMYHFFLKNEMSLSFQEEKNSWQYLLPINSVFQAKIRILEDLYPTQWTWSFQILKNIFDGVGGDINQYDSLI